MFARKTILAATILAGLSATAFAQSTTTPAKPATPTMPAKPTTPSAATTPSNGTMPATNPGASTHGNAMAGSQGIQFNTEAEAKQHCPSDTIVRANLKSKAYHLAGDSFYTSTKTTHRAFMCQTDADSNGFHKAGTRHATTTTKKPS